MKEIDSRAASAISDESDSHSRCNANHMLVLFPEIRPTIRDFRPAASRQWLFWLKILFSFRQEFGCARFYTSGISPLLPSRYSSDGIVRLCVPNRLPFLSHITSVVSTCKINLQCRCQNRILHRFQNLIFHMQLGTTEPGCCPYRPYRQGVLARSGPFPPKNPSTTSTPSSLQPFSLPVAFFARGLLAHCNTIVPYQMEYIIYFDIF